MYDFDLPADECYQKALFYKDKNINKYFIFLTQSANHKYTDAVDLLHREYVTNNDIKQIFDLRLVNFYKITADRNLSYSLNYLGVMYEYGNGVEQNYEKAIELYNKALNQDNTMSMYNLGNIYFHGKGIKKDYKRAIELYYNHIQNTNPCMQECINFCIRILYKQLINDHFTDLEINILTNIDFDKLACFQSCNDDIPDKLDNDDKEHLNVLKFLQKIYRFKIDFLELDTKYPRGQEGFLKAKDDFLTYIIK